MKKRYIYGLCWNVLATVVFQILGWIEPNLGLPHSNITEPLLVAILVTVISYLTISLVLYLLITLDMMLGVIFALGVTAIYGYSVLYLVAYLLDAKGFSVTTNHWGLLAIGLTYLIITTFNSKYRELFMD